MILYITAIASIMQSSTIFQPILLIACAQFILYIAIKIHSKYTPSKYAPQHAEPTPFYYWFEKAVSSSNQQINHYVLQKASKQKEYDIACMRLAQFHGTKDITCSIDKYNHLTLCKPDDIAVKQRYIYTHLVECPIVQCNSASTGATSHFRHNTIYKKLILDRSINFNLNISTTELIKIFIENFNQGIVINIENNTHYNDDLVKEKDWAGIYFGLIDFINAPLKNQQKRFHVTALYNQHIKVIFIIKSKTKNTMSKAKWRKIVHQYNIRTIEKELNVTTDEPNVNS